MRRLIKLVVGLVVVAIVAVIGIGIASGQAGTFIDTLGGNAKAAATNTVLDIGGYKQKIASALESNKETIAAQTGLSVSEVEAVLNNLDIESWEATALPADAQSTGSFSASYSGVDTTVTTYDDPSYVTVEASGLSVTLSVPDSAQDYLPYLAYL